MHAVRFTKENLMKMIIITKRTETTDTHKTQYDNKKVTEYASETNVLSGMRNTLPTV